MGCLLSKNFKPNQRVKIKEHFKEELNGKTGKVIGVETSLDNKWSTYSNIYVVLLDVPGDWPSVIIHEKNLSKLKQK